MVRLDSLFTITYGDHSLNAKEDLDSGNTIVISSQGVDNGCYGFLDVDKKYAEVISVPRTGSIGEAFVQLHQCNIDDNCLVSKPKHSMTKEYLFYVAAIIRYEKWRYMYGRQITPNRLGRVEVISDNVFVPVFSYDEMLRNLTPKKNLTNRIEDSEPRTKDYRITDLFVLERGHFHAIDRLKEGKCPTISRVSSDNGLVGFYEKPKKAEIFPRNLITVSTVTGDAFFQYKPFIATDNVVVLLPKRQFRVTTILYIQAVLNKTKWRYSYGRQCYKRVLQKTILSLPLNAENQINEDYIESIIINQPYWKTLKENILEK